ncbi:MAG: ATP-grasp domain-containing protein, partial [Alphaproteobacteria bacterium]|nr:ATP-grasp domain-containing protein [Alphaproteobacteria bacterium]
ILREARAPAGLGPAVEAAAAEAAGRIAEALDYVGVLAVELFVEADGTLRVNEIAPRVHNSGHWTIEGAQTCQFENHVRAVMGWPLGSTALRGTSVMRNLLGAEAEAWAELAARPGVHLHLYGKRRVAEGRKMGHVTEIGPLPPPVA